MMQSRHKNGLKNIDILYGKAGTDGIKANAKLSTKFDEYICDFAYGEIYERDSLSHNKNKS